MNGMVSYDDNGQPMVHMDPRMLPLMRTTAEGIQRAAALMAVTIQENIEPGADPEQDREDIAAYMCIQAAACIVDADGDVELVRAGLRDTVDEALPYSDDRDEWAANLILTIASGEMPDNERDIAIAAYASMMMSPGMMTLVEIMVPHVERPEITRN